MDSVTKFTILNLVNGNWRPFPCSVCGRCDADIQFAWIDDPIHCWHCAESASQDVKQRLYRAKAAREALGFEKFSRYDLDEALWPNRSRFFPTRHAMPPVFGHPFTGPVLGKGRTAVAYYLHGLSTYPPDELQALVESAPLKYFAQPARPEIVEAYRAWEQYLASMTPGGVSESGLESKPPLRSEVGVYIGGVLIAEAHPESHYMWSWRPEAPWLGYKEGPHETGSLPRKEMDSLFKVGRELLDINFSGRTRGTGRFESDKDLEAAVFDAVAALHKQKRRVTQATVGANIIAKRGRNATERKYAGDSPGDPGRQFRLWCTEFKCNPGDLMQRAIAACANEE